MRGERERGPRITARETGSPAFGSSITYDDGGSSPALGSSITLDDRGASAGRAGEDVPATIARYQIHRRLGAGGMGVVYAARDPVLDRPVAIKLVRQHLADRGLDQHLHREGQALARLDHPNVVTVYDVGIDAIGASTRIYIAMQLVDGGSLDAWLAATPRTRGEILARFVEAGRGLIAVHAAGLVHRDFKPSNVLVDPNGVAKVTDFGLARFVDGGEPAPDSARSASRTSKLAGTPAYMAPEQLVGGAVTPASDQFAFCVALWEALTGTRPFAGHDREALRAAVLAGPVSAAIRLPRRLKRALRRGLAARAADRWPGMEPLLAAIAPRRHAARITAGLVALALVAGAVAWRARGVDHPCAGADHAMDAVWPARRGLIETTLGNLTRTRPGDASAAATLRYLDDRGARWRLARIDACEATEVRHAQAPAVLARRIGCLDRSLAGIAAATDELAAATGIADLVRGPAVAAAGLDPDHCRDDRVARLPAQPAASVDLWRRAIANGDAIRAGRDPQALAAGKALVADAERTGDHQLVSYLWSAIGTASISKAVTRDATRRAAEAAAASGDDVLAAEAWSHATQAAARAGELNAVDDLVAMARAAAARARDPAAALWADVAAGQIALARGDFDAAQAACERVREAGTLIAATRVVEVAMDCLSDVLLKRERWRDAEPAVERQLADLTERLGADDPSTLAARLKLVTAHFHLDRPDAPAEADQLIAAQTRLFGGRSSWLRESLATIANVMVAVAGKSSERSLRFAQQALDVGLQTLAPDDPSLARLYAIVGAQWDGVDHASAKSYAAARVAYDHAMEIYEARRDDVEWAKLAMGVAQLDRNNQRCATAVPLLRQVTSMADAKRLPALFGDGARAETGVCLVETGDFAGAAAALEVAVAAFDHTDVEFAAQYRLWWAEAEWKRGHRPAARRIAQQVVDLLPASSDMARDFHRQATVRYLHPKPGTDGGQASDPPP